MAVMLAGVEWTETRDGHLQHKVGKVRCRIATRRICAQYKWWLLVPGKKFPKHGFAVSRENAARDALLWAGKVPQGEAVAAEQGVA